MAKKKGLRRRLLGSTKTGRLVRAASLAGVLGGGGYLLSRRKGVPTAPSPTASTPSESTPSLPALASNKPATAGRKSQKPRAEPAPVERVLVTPAPSSRRPFTPRRAKNPRPHSNKVSTVPGLRRRIKGLEQERSTIGATADKDLRKGVNKNMAVKQEILAARTRRKLIPGEMDAASQKKDAKEARRRPQSPTWVYPGRTNKRRRRA